MSALWKPYQVLNCKQGELTSPSDIEFILAFYRNFPPQTNTGKPLYDPALPEAANKAAGNEQLMPGYAPCRVSAGNLYLALPNTEVKQRETIAGVGKLLAADPTIVSVLGVDLQMHTLGFDHHGSGSIVVAPGWNWDWMMTCDPATAATYQSIWRSSGYVFDTSPGMQMADSIAGPAGTPAGWLRVDTNARTALRTSVIPDMRIQDCRNWLLDRQATILADLSLSCCELEGKSWHFASPVPVSTPEAPMQSGPWLPTPYPRDSYQQANSDLVREACALHGADQVTWTSTGKIQPVEADEKDLPLYVTTRDGGMLAWAEECALWQQDWAADCYGSWHTAWTREALEARGFREKYIS
jgi:hypothetical protein